MDLLALADFNLVARHGGFSAAARASGRSKATLSRRVAELETSLGVRLMERSSRSLRLTEEGRKLFELTASLLGEIDEAADAVVSGNAHPRGLLRISAPVLFSQIAMGPLAAAFIERYPDVRLEITAEDRTVDMVEEGYDLIIRVNPRPDSELVGRCFLRDRLVCVAPPNIPRPEEGGTVRAVMLSFATQAPSWTVLQHGKRRSMRPEAVLSLSSMTMVRDAALAGSGAACLPTAMVAPHLATGRLVKWGDIQPGSVELWALYANRRLPSAKTAAFLTFLAEAFPEGKPEELTVLLEGAKPSTRRRPKAQHDAAS